MNSKGRGMLRRGEPQAARHRQHAHGRPRAGLGAAGGRHRPRRIEDLLSELKKHAENSPHFFPDDTLTDQPERVLAADVYKRQANG